MLKAWRSAIPVLLLPLLLLFAVSMSSKPASIYIEDPAALIKLPFGASSLAIIGISLWFSSGIIALFAVEHSDSMGKKSLVLLAALCFWLGLDDMLLLHEWILPDLFCSTDFGKKIFEIGLIGSYGVYLLGWMIYFRARLNPVTLSFLATAIGLCALSLFVDFGRALHIFDRWSRITQDKHYAILVEDAPKFVGLFCWQLFTWHYARSETKTISS